MKADTTGVAASMRCHSRVGRLRRRGDQPQLFKLPQGAAKKSGDPFERRLKILAQNLLLAIEIH
jgi:hypothetical protein